MTPPAGGRAPARLPAAPRPGRDAPGERRQHLRVAPAPRRRGVRAACWAGALLAIVSLFAVVAAHAALAQGQVELERLGAAHAEELRRYERLRLQVAEQSAPDAIVTAAVRLGMVPADGVEYLDVPAAAPSGSPVDQTSSTLDRSWDQAKPSLGTRP